MAKLFPPDPSSAARSGGAVADGDVEELSGEVLPAAADGRAGVVVGDAGSGGAVARQAAAVAVGSFAAGLATVAAVRVMGSSRKARRARRARRALPVVATRSFLVDVHLLDPRR